MDIFGSKARKELERQLAEIKAALPDYQEWLLQTAQGEKWTMPDPAIYGNQAELYRKLSWILLSVDLTASAGALTSFNVLKQIAGKEPKDITNHEFELLLQHPNPMDSRFELLYATIAFWKITGNAYWWLNKANEKAAPDEIWFIPSQMIIPVPDERLYIRGYEYQPGNGARIFLETWEIVQFKRFNPFSRFVGLSAIEALALVAAGDLGMQKYNTTLFAANNGRLPSVMTFEQMVADPTWQKIKEDTREASRNREMLMLRGVGSGGVNWIQNAISQRDMEFLDGRKFNKEEIMTVIAPGSFSMLSENSTEANSRTGKSVFMELTVYPMHVMMAEKITNSILPLYGENLLGRFEDIRTTDKDMKLREQDAFERTHTLGEVRQEIYGDDLLGDDRDDMFISQIPSATAVQPEQPLPTLPEAAAVQAKSETISSEINDELLKWEKHVKSGHKRPFVPVSIPPALAIKINAGLKAKKDIVGIFVDAKNDLPLIELARAIEGMNE